MGILDSGPLPSIPYAAPAGLQGTADDWQDQDSPRGYRIGPYGPTTNALLPGMPILPGQRMPWLGAIHLVSTSGSGAGRGVREGKRITTFAVDVGQRPYVRAVVTDAAGRRAWSNPIFPT